MSEINKQQIKRKNKYTESNSEKISLIQKFIIFVI